MLKTKFSEGFAHESHYNGCVLWPEPALAFQHEQRRAASAAGGLMYNDKSIVPCGPASFTQTTKQAKVNYRDFI
jgi:hypothetical protein